MAFLLASTTLHAANHWQEPTAEELKMTSLRELPGAAAVVLYHEEVVDDFDQSWSFYYRIKVLTEKGREDFTSIAIQYPLGLNARSYSVDLLAGRTIHPDGTVIAFTGKPFDRLLKKSSSQSIREKVIALPDIQVGSIIEYRYTLRKSNLLDTRFYYTFVPVWYSQSKYFERQEHFVWHCSTANITWTSTLPAGSPNVQSKGDSLSLDLNNVMPIPDEPQMLPNDYLLQGVSFYQVPAALHASQHLAQDFWNLEGKIWSKNIDDFIGSPSRLSGPLAQIIGNAILQEDKLRRIYAAVQQMQNTNFLLEHSDLGEKTEHESPPKSVVDVFEHRRGDNLQLTYLFIALARAAGMKAYIMAVTNRDLNAFTPNFLSFRQLNDDVAIVEIDGHERFFDPAEPFCPFGQLFWTHANASGIRQTDSGTTLVDSPHLDYKENQTRRTASLNLEEDGHVTGTVDLTVTGASATSWRQSTLLDDEQALRESLDEYLTETLPAGSEITLHSIDHLKDENDPLVVHFEVRSPWGNSTGKRLILPSQFFQVAHTDILTSKERKTPVYWAYPERITDDVVLNLKPGWQVESHPAKVSEAMLKVGLYRSATAVNGQSLILQRDYDFAGTVVPPNLYSDLRDFYMRVDARDRAPVLIRLGDSVVSEQQ